MKVLFTDIKRFIEKDLKENEGGENAGKTNVSRDIMNGGKAVTWTFQKYTQSLRDNKPQSSERLTKREFGEFIKFVT